MDGLFSRHVNEESGIHESHMDVINFVPNAVYWVDLECKLRGFNYSFLSLLGLEELCDYQGTPYDLFIKYLKWDASRVEKLKLDDVAIIFSGKSKYDVEEEPIKSQNGKELFYISTRIPLLNKERKISGLVVILVDNKKNTNATSKKVSRKLNLLDQYNGKTPRVLVVEDNLVAQKVGQSLLQNFGCEVDIAETGEDALVLFSPGKYDVVLMDISLQDTSGYMVSKKIREQEYGTEHNVPIIALTSYNADVVKHDCREYFMAGAITKPLTINQAEQIIQCYVYDQNISVAGLISA